MENSYGIGVTNRYALFLDDAEDPLEVLKVQEQEKEAKKKTKLSEKENKGKTETKGKSAQAPRKGIKETQNVKTLESGKSKEDSNKKTTQRSTDRTERNVKFAGESREERNNRRNREDKPSSTAPVDFNREPRDREGPRPDSDARQRGRGSGRGLGRGGRGSRGTGRGYDNRGKREFDRQSGSDKTRPNYSGVKPVDKREGGGAHNWGNHKDDIEELNTSHSSEDQHDWAADKPEGESHPTTTESADTKDTETAVTTAGSGSGGGGGGGDAAAEVESAPPVEEEPRELTLDEYKALKGNRQKPTYNLRKAGEGEDMTQWKKMYALKKKEGEEEDDDEEEYDVSEYPQRVGRQKHLLDIDIHFADSRRGTRGRGRGGPRGGGRGGPRGAGGPPRNGTPGSRVGGSGDARGPGSRDRGDRFGERGDRFDRERGDRPERDSYQPRGPRQSAPKVDDEHDFPSLG
ncbi:plasminogen activator inhibitor 1 RNA-binding protein-like isoform X3 [Zootermopsis nevadensis]|uniref:plasminogen activator inhibitor 1 RNA-binding protein-like isoform X3 n=1 Tax=Zootermopsis nevadensis TaxID=136037 RepID=UPI000B8EB6BF|nr:plasminogen activator inhibitor 1 RNA-binding protein-like isoform X3 [Zootermopsis nevadensis]